MIPRNLGRELYELWASALLYIVSAPILLIALFVMTDVYIIGMILTVTRVIREHTAISFADRMFSIISAPLDWLQRVLKI